jgi:hypothetical protein
MPRFPSRSFPGVLKKKANSAALMALALTIGGISVAACSSSAAPTTSSTSSGIPTSEAPLPAGAEPSDIALMICQSKAAGEIQDVLGEKTEVIDKTWTDHRYSCEYKFKSGTIKLSIKELSTWSQTLDYFSSLASSLHRMSTLSNLGQGAFQVQNGNVVVRKDWKILLVDITGLPAQFGSPPTTRSDVAVTVAFIILGCWAGD